MRAVALRQAGQPTSVEELALRPIGAHEVRVRLHAIGLCHSDVSLRDGAIPTLVPSTLGHEGAGVVTEVGSEVSTVGAGQHVVLTWNVPCRSCPHCLRGEAELFSSASDATPIPGHTGPPAALGVRAAVGMVVAVHASWPPGGSWPRPRRKPASPASGRCGRSPNGPGSGSAPRASTHHAVVEVRDVRAVVTPQPSSAARSSGNDSSIGTTAAAGSSVPSMTGRPYSTCSTRTMHGTCLPTCEGSSLPTV